MDEADLSRAVVIYMADLPARVATGPHLVELTGADPIPRTGLDLPVFRYLGPGLDDGVLAFLSGLVAADIRKRGKTIDRFAPREGQDPGEAADVLEGFRSRVEWRRAVLGRLADLTGDPAAWRASAAVELPDDDGDLEGDETCECGHPVRHGSGAAVTCDVCGAFCCEAHHRVSPRYARHDLTGVPDSDQSEVSPDLLSAARSWIADCEWIDVGPDDIADLTDAQVVSGIRNNYEGGWAQFMRDGGL